MLSFAIKHRNIIDLCVSIPASMFVNMVKFPSSNQWAKKDLGIR